MKHGKRNAIPYIACALALSLFAVLSNFPCSESEQAAYTDSLAAQAAVDSLEDSDYVVLPGNTAQENERLNRALKLVSEHKAISE